MHTSIRRVIFAAFAIIFSFSISGLWAQSAGSAGTIYGTVTDATGAIVPGATVISIQNPVSGYSRTTTSDSAGHYQFTNLPLNPYHLIVSVKGFAPYSQDVEVRSFVPITLKNILAVGADFDRRRRYGHATCWRAIRRFTPTSIAARSASFRWRASPPRSVRW